MEHDTPADPAELIEDPGPFPSTTPQYRFADGLDAQESQLRDNPLMLRFADSRRAMAGDPYRPAYHFVSPESTLNDPNGLTYWQGQWHLFYQAYPPDEFPDIADIRKRRQHWGHAVSEDLVHWRDLPYAIYPGIERMVFSGGTVVDGDRVVAFYPGIDAPGKPIPGFPTLSSGQMVAVSTDPLLLNWEKSGPIDIEHAGDSHIWKEGDTFYGLVGWFTRHYPEEVLRDPRDFHVVYQESVAVQATTALWSSQDLVTWKSEGNLVADGTPFTSRFDEACCPYFLPIGDRHILLFFSHRNGGQYFLGNYDESTHRFQPYDHGRFNHGQLLPDGVHAPSAAVDGDGGVIHILNINSGHVLGDGWDHIMSLPQRLTLGDDQRLRIAPAPGVETLRGAHVSVADTVIPERGELLLPSVQGNALEIELEIDLKDSRLVEIDVLRSSSGEERTTISFYPHTLQADGSGNWIQEEIVLDGAHAASSGPALSRPPERAVVRRGDENLRLRIFIDRSVVEVFVNDTQYLAIRVYPTLPDSVGVALRSQRGDAVLKSLDAWQMTPIWPIEESPTSSAPAVVRHRSRR